MEVQLPLLRAPGAGRSHQEEVDDDHQTGQRGQVHRESDPAGEEERKDRRCNGKHLPSNLTEPS